MARIYNKINLPTNTTDIQMFSHYLKAIESVGCVKRSEEQDLFASVKKANSRKNTEAPSQDTHTRQTLALFGLISISDDDSFAISNLGKEVVSFFNNPDEYSEEKRIALMLKVFLRWELKDDTYQRYMHPGYIIVRLLCDADLDFYFTNQEFAHFVMKSEFVSDRQYDQIKQSILDFRKGIGISEYVAQSKAGTFLASLVGNWNILKSEDVDLNSKQSKLGDKYYLAYLSPESEEETATEEDIDETEDLTVLDDNIVTGIDTKSMTASQRNAYSAFHTVKKFSLTHIASFIARTFFHQKADEYITDYTQYFYSDLLNDTKKYLQDIYFGSPGTGKSFKVKNDLLEGVKEEYIFRTTFHPDTDYSSFVGCYKPIATINAVQQFSEIDELVEQYKLDVLPAEVSKVGYIEARIKFGINYCQYFGGRFADYEINDLLEKAGMAFEGDSDKYRVGQTYIRYGVNIGLESDLLPDAITYDFVPETFTEAYVKAWTNPTKQIYLVIEEINRGNCAQIFGDIFQLLDRKNGISEYPVKADTALANYLRKKLKGAAAKGIADGKLCLPDNFNIIATMNTSDQSLFPMDSAFKRRWGWRCIPTISPADKTKTIKFTLTKGVTTNYGTKVSAGTYEYDWTTFLECINEKIREATNSDDKQLGFWFVKTEDEEGIISAEVFVSKVVFYLWNDIFKDMGRRDNNPFSIEVGEVRKIMSYNTFFELDSDTKNVVENLGILYTFLGNLGLKPKSANLESDE